MSFTTDDAPTHVPLDRTLSKTVDAALRVLLDTFADISSESAREVGIWGSLPIITSEHISEFLTDSVTPRPDASPFAQPYLATLVTQASLSFLQAKLELDIAMTGFLKDKGTVCHKTLYVNDPVIIGALGQRNLPEGEMVMVPVADFYTTSPLEGDTRRDLLMAAVRWKGIYLCRPALVSLPEIEDLLTAADRYGTLSNSANVAYLPLYGAH